MQTRTGAGTSASEPSTGSLSCGRGKDPDARARLKSAPRRYDFVALYGAGDGPEATHFAAGKPVEGPRAGARLVLHADLPGDALRAWEATGALCVPAARLLTLLAPEEARRDLDGARDLGERYVRAASRLLPHSEVLRTAAELLPAQDAALRSLLHRTVAEIAVA